MATGNNMALWIHTRMTRQDTQIHGKRDSRMRSTDAPPTDMRDKHYQRMCYARVRSQ